MKKVLSWILAFCLLVTAVPLTANAENIHQTNGSQAISTQATLSTPFIQGNQGFSSLSQAVAAAQTGDKTVFLAENMSYTATEGEVIPAGITLAVQKGASFSFGNADSFTKSKGLLRVDAGGILFYPGSQPQSQWIGADSSSCDIKLSEGQMYYDLKNDLLSLDKRSKVLVPSGKTLSLGATLNSGLKIVYNLDIGSEATLTVDGTLDVSASETASSPLQVTVNGTLTMFDGVLKLAKGSAIEVNEGGRLQTPPMSTQETDDAQPVEWVNGKLIFNYGSSLKYGNPNANDTIGFTTVPRKDGKVIIDFSNIKTSEGYGFVKTIYFGEVDRFPNGTAVLEGNKVHVVHQIAKGGKLNLRGKMIASVNSQLIIEPGGTFEILNSKGVLGGALQIEKGSSINGEITLSEGSVVVRDPSAINGATIKLNGQNTTVLADTDISSKIKGKYRPIEDKEKLSFNCAIAGLVDMVPFKMGWEYGEPVVPEEPTLYKNTTNNPSNGSVRISPAEAKEGDTVTITVTPNDGYETGTVSATRKDGTAVALTSTGTGNYTFVQPASDVSVSVSFEETAPQTELQTTTIVLPNGYTSTKTVAPQGDVLLVITNSAGDTLANIYVPSVLGEAKDFVDNRSGWFKEAVNKASALGLFNGVSETEFAPNSPMTRAMLVTVLHNLSSKPWEHRYFEQEEIPFNDVPINSWYERPVGWAWSLGITAGTGSGFSPSDNITREQLVTMLYHYAELIGVGSDKRTSLSSFSDSGDVSSYAYDAMRWAVAEGFVNGMGDGTLAPKGNATRAQVASILTKFVESIAGRDVTAPPAVPLSTQNGYYICPICKFVNEEGTPCIACSTIDQAKPEEYCPTCGGGYDVGGVVPWVYCYYCKDYFSGPEEPYYSCRRCGKFGLRPSDLDPESELCADCFDPNPQYCTECGRSSNVVTITRYGYCEDCYQKNHAGEFGYCEVCGGPLSAVEAIHCGGKRCFSCSICKYCGDYVTDDEYNKYGEFICDACSQLPRVYCAECGTDITGDQTVNGLCFKCFSSHPNVYCPNCGYGFFTTGVGTDGFFCPECGYNWLPGLQ